MKKIYALFIFVLLFVPDLIVKAETDDNLLVLVSQNEKYYKTISYNNIFNSINSISNNSSTYTVEVTKQEYDMANSVATLDSATVETTYKKLVSSIYQNGVRYRYKAELTWKNMPSTRSYDIIGIGHYASVKRDTGPYFSLYYCRTDGTCTTTNSYYPQTFSGGSGASFKLPTGALTALKATFYFDVIKSDSSTTVYGQLAASDYSHATSSVTANQSKDYTVTNAGIILGSSIINKYDAMNSANATWSGTW